MDFVEKNRPRHHDLELLQALTESKTPAPVFVALTEPRDRRETLIDMYLKGDVRLISVDATVRPNHYNQRQHEIIRHLGRKAAINPPPTSEELNELFHAWNRPSELARATKRTIQKTTDSRHTRPPVPAEHPSVFEEQNFGGKVIV